jgi:hypothetical protein
MLYDIKYFTMMRRVIATTELLLIFPAALFMSAIFVRNLQPQQYEPARTAARIVSWYSLRPHVGLWVLLMALPLAGLVTGLGAIAGNWSADADLRMAARQAFAAVRAHLSMLLIAAATLTSAVILAIVALHVLTD